MQMYKVAFTSRRGRAIETGLYLVCASNADQAKDMVSTMFNIPPKATDFDVSRIKPSIYRIKHTDFIKDDITAVVVNSSAANHPSQDEGALYEISVSSKVFAFSEKSAIRTRDWKNSAKKHTTPRTALFIFRCLMAARFASRITATSSAFRISKITLKHPSLGMISAGSCSMTKSSTTFAPKPSGFRPEGRFPTDYRGNQDA